jgi:hypothetical protein
MRVGTLFSYLCDNYDVVPSFTRLAHIIYINNVVNKVFIQENRDFVYRIWFSFNLGVYIFKSKPTELLRVNKISIFLNENFIYYIVYINNVCESSK